MSRIGNKAVAIPSGVTANVEGQTVKIKGPKGAMQVMLHDDVTVTMDKASVKLEPRGESKRARSMWGTSRTLVANLVAGVTKGFEERLEITGVGYRAALQGKKLQLALGYSHPIEIDPPAGISFALETPQKVRVAGADKEVVGEIAAKIRALRVPDPYKAKGVKYAGEYIRRKAGKAGKVGAKA